MIQLELAKAAKTIVEYVCNLRNGEDVLKQGTKMEIKSPKIWDSLNSRSRAFKMGRIIDDAVR